MLVKYCQLKDYLRQQQNKTLQCLIIYMIVLIFRSGIIKMATTSIL